MSRMLVQPSASPLSPTRRFAPELLVIVTVTPLVKMQYAWPPGRLHWMRKLPPSSRTLPPLKTIVPELSTNVPLVQSPTGLFSVKVPGPDLPERPADGPLVTPCASSTSLLQVMVTPAAMLTTLLNVVVPFVGAPMALPPDIVT